MHLKHEQVNSAINKQIWTGEVRWAELKWVHPVAQSSRMYPKSVASRKIPSLTKLVLVSLVFAQAKHTYTKDLVNLISSASNIVPKGNVHGE